MLYRADGGLASYFFEKGPILLMFPRLDDSGRGRGGERSDQGEDGVIDVRGQDGPCHGDLGKAIVSMRFKRVGTRCGTGTFGKSRIWPFYRGF